MLYKAFLKICIILVPVLAALVLVFYNLMPKVVEIVVLQQIKEIEALSDVEFDISHMGFSGIHIRNIQKGEGMKADSLYIGYSLTSLMNKRVERITISGLRLNLDSYDAGNRQGRQKEFDLKKLPDKVLPYMGKAGSIEVTNSALTKNVLGSALHVSLEARLDFDKNERKIVFSGEAFPFSQKVKINAEADFDGKLQKVVIKADDFMLDHLSPFISRIDPALSVSGKTDLRIFKQAGENISFSVSKVLMEKPFPVRVENMEAAIFVKNGEIGFEGVLSAETDRTSPVPMKVRGSFVPKDGNRFSLYAENMENGPLTAEYKGRQAVIENPRFSVQVNSESSKLSAFCSAGFSRLEVPSARIELLGGKVHVPVRFPIEEDVETGTFGVSSLVLPGGLSLKVEGTVRQTRSGADIKGDAEVLNLSGIECGFEGSAGVKDSGEKSFGMRFSVKPARINENIVKQFVKESIHGMSFEALVAARGEIRYSGGNLESDLTVDVREGQLAILENKLEMENIETEVRFDDVWTLAGKPGLNLGVEKISMQQLIFEDVRVGYTIESATSVLVENTSFKWCGGHVSAESFRIKPDKKSYAFVLYCDRLRLADLLETVAGFEASGEGTLSGRIPLGFDQGEISFQDAFLFTSPGSGGHIRLKNSSIITKGIPEDTARYTQMDLAKEALKNYEYEWAKLFFDTKGEKLDVKLRFDGKPADVLPFEYNRELGRFSRVDASARGSRFQGIKIDVNLTLPFNQVLKYGKELDKLF